MVLFVCVLWWEKECWRNVQFNQNCYQSLMSFYIFDELLFFHVPLYDIGVKLTQIGYITKIFVKWICFDIPLTTIVKFPASSTFIKSIKSMEMYLNQNVWQNEEGSQLWIMWCYLETYQLRRVGTKCDKPAADVNQDRISCLQTFQRGSRRVCK